MPVRSCAIASVSLKPLQHMFLKEMMYTLVEEAQVKLHLLVVHPDQQKLCGLMAGIVENFFTRSVVIWHT